MKRFQTKKRRKKYTWIILFIIFTILFSLFSMLNLNRNIGSNILLLFEKQEFNNFKMTNYCFNSLFNISAYKKDINLIAKNNSYNLRINGDLKLFSFLDDNLRKLGIKSIISDNPSIRIEYGDIEETITKKNKTYAKIKIFLPEKYNKYKSFIQEKYSEFIIDIINNDNFTIKIGNKKNNLELQKNSTEIVSLILYAIFGD